MTSKRALVELVIEAELVNANKKRISFLMNEIEKDLEVLEILKKKLEVKLGNSWWYLDTKHCFFETQEELNKIKEWLDNEK